MWLCRLLALSLATLALAACARQMPRYAAAPQQFSELDARMYGTPQLRGVAVATPVQVVTPQVVTPRAYTPTPAQSYVLRRAVPVMQQVVPAAVTIDSEGPYTLDAGDKLRVVVFGQDALSNTYTVDAQGQVVLPLIGTVQARGMTTSQLGSAIASRLKQSYIRDPSVAVEIETYRPFFVLGEVTYPGQYPYVPNMTVENAIAIAGGFTPRAFKDKFTITRAIQGVPTRLLMPRRYPVRPGDTIEVSERWF